MKIRMRLRQTEAVTPQGGRKALNVECWTFIFMPSKAKLRHFVTKNFIGIFLVSYNYLIILAIHCHVVYATLG
jgi:hypothetical protein